jgi:hypothetical protein
LAEHLAKRQEKPFMIDDRSSISFVRNSMEDFKGISSELDGNSTSTTLNQRRIEGMPFQKNSVSPSSDFQTKVEYAHQKTVSFYLG